MLNIFLKKVFGDPNEKHLKKMSLLVDQINGFEKVMEGLSDEKLKLKTEEFKKRLKDGEGLDDILPEVFAVVREASKRVLGQRHFDVQLIGGIVLHQGKIAEMRTGEGKTLTSTLAVYLNALKGNGCHLVTVNDYLAKRDTVWMGQIYAFLGLSIGCILSDKTYIYNPASLDSKKDKERDTKGGFKIEEEYLTLVTKKEAYAADITYGTNNEFGFDYLRDNMSHSLENKVQRELNFVIIDEVDSILIDEARTPLIISAPDQTPTSKYQEFSLLVKQLKEDEDYNIDEKMRVVSLTEDGITKIEKILRVDNIYEEKGLRDIHHIEEALKAKCLYKKDKNYLIKDNEVIIIDEFTGRMMPGRRWSGGLHQAVEAKEGVEIKKESKTMATITFQNYFKMYKKISGMTGTAVTSKEEFEDVYNLEVIVIPTNLPMVRKNLEDKVYKTEEAKYRAIIEEIKERQKRGQPVLIGTVSVEKNEYLSKLLDRSGISHNILNAKNHEKEGEIIAQAGERGRVTVATNMAGRGVDIKLGGGVFDKIKYEKVKALGGLFILGTERHEARRIDNQLRGRSGRQGDPGEAQFFISLEDDVMRIFGGEKIQSIMNMLKLPEDMPIENKLLSNTIESAQSRIEGFYFDARKNLLNYDNIMNKQRLVFYKKRDEILKLKDIENKGISDKIKEMIRVEINKIVNFHCQDKYSDNWDIKEISENISSFFIVEIDVIKKELENIINKEEEKQGKEGKKEMMLNYLYSLSDNIYQSKREELLKDEKDEKKLNGFLGAVTLQVMDLLWVEHLVGMDELRDSVKIRAYGQRDPLAEYTREGHQMFEQLLETIDKKIAYTIFKISIPPKTPYQQYRPAKTVYSGENQVDQKRGILKKQRVSTVIKKVGRNDPCPCGSGKKYKKCCLN